MSCTHSFSMLAVSRAAYDEIAGLLQTAGYGHVFVGGAIDMMGIALITEQPEVCRLPPPGWRCTRGAGHDGPCAAVPEEP